MDWIIVAEIFLWIILSIVFSIFVVLVLPIRLDVSYDGDKWEAKIKILFFSIDLLNSRFSKNSKTKNNDEKKSKFKNFENVYKFFASFKSLINAAKRMFVLAIKKITVEDLLLEISVGADDAAKTSVVYGNICSAVYPVTAWLMKIKEPKSYKIFVSPNFLSDKIDFRMSLIVKTNILSLLIVGIEILKTMKSLNKKINRRNINEYES